MGLRNFLSRRRTPGAAKPWSVAPAPVIERAPLTPAQQAHLEDAWAELRQAAQEAGVKSLRACTPDSSRLEDNPDTVRAMTRIIQGTQKDTEEARRTYSD